MLRNLIIRRRSLSRLIFLIIIAFIVRLLFFSSSSSSYDVSHTREHQIEEHGLIDRDRTLNVQRHPFLQSRMGRDVSLENELMGASIQNGIRDYWQRFQMPYILSKDTSSQDTQHVLSAIDQLLSLNGWVAALCPTLVRPFGQNQHADRYDDLISSSHLYFFAIVIHSADHFLTDQLAVIVQMAKRLGTRNLFVSMLDYDSTDSTETLTDLCEGVLTLLGVPFRIRRVPAMTSDPGAAYYPLEESHMRNLALEPLHELKSKRGISFSRVIWLKGFTCPNDILETIKISFANEAAMVCGMDWAEHNGFFIFSDRWRTRDIDGDQFRQSKSSASMEGSAVPPRDKNGAERYVKHLPFQVFCCEAGTHVVDPAQSYYKGLSYRASPNYHNLSEPNLKPSWASNAPCLDSTQAWFCRDLWVRSARDAMEEVDANNNPNPVNKFKRWIMGEERTIEEVSSSDPWMDEALSSLSKRDEDVKVEAVDLSNKELSEEDINIRQNQHAPDADANAGSDYDAMSPEEENSSPFPGEAAPMRLSIPNSVFRPARILVNPRCITTYAGVSHTQLSRDLFGLETKDQGGKYVLDDWEGAPESFVCQEQRTTGGRKATKTQRRLAFSVHEELGKI